MANTIAAAFADLRSNLEITDLQATTVSTRQQNVRAALEDDFKILASFLSGSYARSTMIAPLTEADIDVFFVLDPSYFAKYSPAQLLDAVRQALLKTYTRTPKISRNGQAVTITFTDFQVDVVPGFHRKGGGYLIPDSTQGSWISTDPTVHNDLMINANKTHKGDLVPSVKMIKGWNRVINRAFDGFYLELMTMNILDGVKISDFSSGVRFIFDKGREKVKYTIPDPAGYGGQVRGLVSASTVAEAVSRFEAVHQRALNAEALASCGRVTEALQEWRKVFGSYFPA